MARSKEKESMTPAGFGFGDHLQPFGVDAEIIPDPREDLPAAVQWYTYAVKTALAEYQVEHDIETFQGLRQLQWNHVLQYIQQRVFKRNGRLTFALGDPIQVNAIADIYINTCYQCNKTVSLYGFSYFVGIAPQTLYNWQQDKTRSEVLYIDINTGEYIKEEYIETYMQYVPGAKIIRVSNDKFKDIVLKITGARQHTLEDKAEDGSVMALALGKIQFGWEEGRRAQLQAENMEKYALPEDLIAEYDK